jgi:hypothetical protein
MAATGLSRHDFVSGTTHPKIAWQYPARRMLRRFLWEGWGERRYWLPLPGERELVVSGATAGTLAMVSHDDSFDSTGGVAAIDTTLHASRLTQSLNSRLTL